MSGPVYKQRVGQEELLVTVQRWAGIGQWMVSNFLVDVILFLGVYSSLSVFFSLLLLLLIIIILHFVSIIKLLLSQTKRLEIFSDSPPYWSGSE